MEVEKRHKALNFCSGKPASLDTRYNRYYRDQCFCAETQRESGRLIPILVYGKCRKTHVGTHIICASRTLVPQSAVNEVLNQFNT